jgi:transcriptional regulator with XRE-family HTH domain
MADKINFADWLEKELTKSKLSQSDLAREAGVTRAAINGILTGARGPGIDLLNGIAKALHIPVEEIYRVAGILPPAPNENKIIKQITHLTNDLPESEQEGILEFVKLRHRLSEDRGKYETKRTRKKSASTR